MLRAPTLVLLSAALIGLKPLPAASPRVAVAFSPDSRVLALAGYREVLLVEPASGKMIRRLPGHTGPVTGIAFSPGGQTLAVTAGLPGKVGEIRLWDLKGSHSTVLPALHTDVVYAAAWTPDGKRLAACSYDRTVSLWEVATRKGRLLKDHTDAVYSVGFSPDGKLIASAAGDRTVKIWDAATGKRLYSLSDAAAELYAVAFHPSGRQVAAGGVDRMLRTWSVGPGAGALLRSAFAHDGPIVRLAYTPDGSRLYTTSEDRTLKLWNADTLAEERVFERQPDWAMGLAPSPDGNSVAVSRYDGSAALYDAATGRPRPLSLPQ